MPASPAAGCSASAPAAPAGQDTGGEGEGQEAKEKEKMLGAKVFVPRDRIRGWIVTFGVYRLWEKAPYRRFPGVSFSILGLDYIISSVWSPHFWGYILVVSLFSRDDKIGLPFCRRIGDIGPGEPGLSSGGFAPWSHLWRLAWL